MAPVPSVGGEGTANLDWRRDPSAEGDARRSVSERGGRRERDLQSVQQFAGRMMMGSVFFFFSPINKTDYTNESLFNVSIRF